MPASKKSSNKAQIKTAVQTPDAQTENSFIFDSVFRTILEKMPEMAVPLINEAFKMNYPHDVKLQQLRNEHETKNGRRQTDLLIRIKDRMYHLECQSTGDGRMVIRMIEYDFAISLENIKKENGRYLMEFPHSSVLFLRGKHIRDSIDMDLRFPDGQNIVYRVPVIWLSDYTMDKIFQKNLLLLLPYYIIKYEKNKQRLEKDDEYLTEMLTEYQRMMEYLKTELLDKKQEKTYRDMIELIIRIADYVLKDSEKAKQEVDRMMMDGTLLKLQSDYLIEQGEKRGMKMGENRINILGQRLSEDGRLDDLMKSFTDPNLQEKLLKEYGL